MVTSSSLDEVLSRSIGVRGERIREKHTKDSAMIVLRPAAILEVCRVH